ncbi:hypothetical protein FRX31_017954 [Thalictrum thalictroides]|uniref:F-box associated beta-propeller type 3 domain-containing protein n=1 Tax=Thalictrum thalictroides TaxID=46969 RepID=A0A7J6W7N7_THATH|nr:hypothetical protein FRX31_017954 [Thalictrum thalictroides]
MDKQLPWEIIFQEILPRIPAKTLIQYKCVSKDWYTSISSSSNSFFIKTHLDYWKSKSSNGVIQQPCDECYTFHDEETGEHFDLELHKLFNDDRKILIPFASYDGLLLVQSIDYGNTHSFPSYYVCNPITRQLTKLPHPPFWLYPSEISFDPTTYKYKVVSWSNQQGCAIFTLGDDDGSGDSSSWRLVPLPSDVGDMYTRGVSVNGALYWVSISISCSINEPVSSSMCFILSLDMNKEEIKKINMPTEEEYNKPPILVEFKGGLYAVFNSEENLEKLVIWELDDWKKYIWKKITKKCSNSEYVYTCVTTIVARNRLKLQNGILPLRRKNYQYCLDHVNSLVSWDDKAFRKKKRKWCSSRGFKLVSYVTMFYLFFVFQIYPVVTKGS